VKNSLLVIPLVFLLCFAFACQKGEKVAKEPAVDVEAEKEAIITKFRDEIRIFDELQKEGNISEIAEAYVSWHTDDAVLMFPGEPAIIGSEDIYSYMKDNFSKVLDEYVYEFPNWKTEELQVTDNWAFHRFSGIALLRPKKGEKLIELDRKYLDIWKKLPNGEWKIAIHSFNLNK